MTPVTATYFRNNQASVLDRVDQGEDLYITRGRRRYAIVPIADDGLTVTPELQARIDEALDNVGKPGTVICHTHDELDRFLAAL